MPGGTFMPYVVMAFFVFLLWAFTKDADTLTGLLATPIWFVVVGIGYLLLRNNPQHHKLRQACGACSCREAWGSSLLRFEKRSTNKDQSSFLGKAVIIESIRVITAFSLSGKDCNGSIIWGYHRAKGKISTHKEHF